jgi:hypothetical protein
MKEKRKRQRRKLLSEGEFRRLIETGEVTSKDRRLWRERRDKRKKK